MCPQYTDVPAVGYLTIKLKNSTWYKCHNRSLTGSHMYVRMYIVCTYVHTYVHTFVQKDVHSNARTVYRKNICPRHHPMRGGGGGVEGVHKMLDSRTQNEYTHCFHSAVKISDHILHTSNLSIGSCYLGVHGCKTINVQLYKHTDAESCYLTILKLATANYHPIKAAGAILLLTRPIYFRENHRRKVHP